VKDKFGAVRNGQGKGIPKAELPLGAVVLRTHNGRTVRYVKTRKDGPSGRRWTPYAKWWWEKNKGPVPAGSLVLHRDGDSLNDEPKNLVLGTPGMKLVLRHGRSAEWSRSQHRRAARGCAEKNRERGRINRASNFLRKYWYPVVDAMGVIFNLPFRRRKRILACFGADVRAYPASGQGKKPSSAVQRALSSVAVRPTRAADLSLRRYETYCLADPSTGEFRGPMGASVAQIVAQLERMGVWAPAIKYGKTDLSERK
jgi:hypothetical protein